MAVFTFTEEKILDSSIQPDSSSAIFFATKTEKKSLQRQVTTLTPGSDAKAPGALLGGTINWQADTIEIGGARRKIKEIKRKVGGWFSRHEFCSLDIGVGPGLCIFVNSTREWQWSESGRPYVLKYKRKQWTVITPVGIMLIRE